VYGWTLTMVSLQQIRQGLTDESLRFATLVGFVSIPFTVVFSGRPEPYVVAGAPLLIAGLIVGWFYSKRPTDRRCAGTRTGLVASIGVIIWQISYMVSVIQSEAIEIAVVAAVLTPMVAIIGIGLSVLVVMIGAVIGHRLTARVGRIRSNGINN